MKWEELKRKKLALEGLTKEEIEKELERIKKEAQEEIDEIKENK